RIPGKHGGPAESFALVTVLVDDAPGSIVSALQAVADVGVNVEDLRMEHSSGYQVGMLEIAVVPGQKQHLVDSLPDLRWTVLYCQHTLDLLSLSMAPQSPGSLRSLAG